MRGRIRTPPIAYLFLLPAGLVFLLVFVYPLASGIRTSLSLYGFGRLIEFVGFENYRIVFSDPAFWGSLWVTAKFVALTVTIETALGLGLALLCANELRGFRFARVVLLMPMVVMPVVVGIVFTLIYASDVGLITVISKELGGDAVQILSGETSAFFAVVALDVWEWTPLMFLILLAGIQALPVEPLEAARVDGAGRWRTFADHTLPMLRPVIAVAVILRMIDAFATFDQVFVLTQGGPGRATELIAIRGYYTAFQFQEVGIAAAMLLSVTVIVVALAALLVRTIRAQRRADA